VDGARGAGGDPHGRARSWVVLRDQPGRRALADEAVARRGDRDRRSRAQPVREAAGAHPRAHRQGGRMKELEALIQSAKRVRANAHAPYSRYHVGAAVLGDDGKIYAGCNVENASYGLALCAERGAVATAIAGGVKKITAAAVITSTSPP